MWPQVLQLILVKHINGICVHIFQMVSIESFEFAIKVNLIYLDSFMVLVSIDID